MNMTRVSKITSDLQVSPVSVMAKVDTIPTPNYTKLSEKLRQSTNPQFQCAMFCGGRKCKYESSSNWTDNEKALPGIFSHWITDDILAMARPNTETIHKYDLIHYFHENNIKSIINLQEPGEHANCGNALTSSGFSYDPTLFMENNVYFYNFQWKDYSIVTDEVVLDMVKVMTFALTEGKVAVHCHAGLGRTGVLIASYLVFTYRCKPQDAIKFVRLKRPNSIQTRGQIMSVFQFSQYIIPFFVIYQHIIPKQIGFTLAQILHKQRSLLHGYELRHLKYIPKILFVICERLLKLCGRHKVYSRGITKHLPANNTEISVNFQLENSESFCKYFFSSATSGIDLDREERPNSNMTSQPSSGIMSPDTDSTELASLSTNDSRNSTADSKNRNSKNETIVDNAATTSMQRPSLSPVEESGDKNNFLCDDFISAPMHQIGLVGLETPKKSNTNSTSSSERLSSLSDSLTSLIEKTLGYRILQIDSSQMLCEQEMDNYDNNNESKNSNSYLLEDRMICEEYLENDYYDIDEDSLDAQCSSGFISANCGNCTEDEDCEIKDRIRIINALNIDYNSHDKTFANALLRYQKEINSKQSGWDRLNHETCVEMLCALMWSWIESLKEPILNKNSLCYIVIKAEKPLDALLKLDQPTRYTVEYLIRFIARLKPDEETQDILLRQLMAILTKQRFKLFDGKLVPDGRDWPEMRKGTAGRVMLFTNGIYQFLNSN